MLETYTFSFEEKQNISKLTFSLFISIIIHSLIIIIMIYFSFKAIAEGKIYSFGKGSVMQVNIYNAGELRVAGLNKEETTHKEIWTYKGEEGKRRCDSGVNT